MPKVLVRADANARIGWGHAVRTGALAEGLRRAGWRVRWLALDSDAAALDRLRRSFPVTRIAGEIADDARARLEERPAPGDWVVVDRYGWTAGQHRALRAAGWRVAVIDDEGRGRFDADLVVNPNAGAERLRYRGGPGMRVLAGSAYALLRREFRAAGARRPGASAFARRVLVSFGGADPAGLSGRVCRLLAVASPAARATVVMGPSARPAEFGRDVTAVRGATAARMRRLMETSDAAVLAPSSTWAELARIGIPAAVLSYADNQHALGRRLGRLGLAEDLGRHDRIADNRLSVRLAAFLGDAARRRSLSRAARRAVDGRGVDRVIEAMER